MSDHGIRVRFALALAVVAAIVGIVFVATRDSKDPAYVHRDCVTGVLDKLDGALAQPTRPAGRQYLETFYAYSDKKTWVLKAYESASAMSPTQFAEAYYGAQDHPWVAANINPHCTYSPS